MQNCHREILCKDPLIVVDYVGTGSSVYLFSFDPELTHDMAIVNIQRVCREVHSDTKGRVTVWSDQIENGLVVIYENPVTAFLHYQDSCQSGGLLARWVHWWRNLFWRLWVMDSSVVVPRCPSPEVEDALYRLVAIICDTKNNADVKNPFHYISSDR